MSKYYVYIHKRLDNDEIFYIGKGCGNRAYQKTSRNPYWHNIVKKYGYYAEFIETDLKEIEASELETKLILEIGRKDLGIGFLCNMTDGGDGKKSTIVTSETRLKMSISAKNKPPMTKDTKRLLFELNSGENNPMFNKSHTEDTKNKISKNKLGFKHTDDTKLKMSKSAINRPRASEETRNKIAEFNVGNKNANKAICKIDEIGNIMQCWISIKECADQLNLTISGISKVLKGRSHKTKGHKFIYK